MGGLPKIVVLLTLSLAGLSYWLYTPIPAGYSTSSANSLRVFLAVMKVSEVAIGFGEFIGLGTYAEISRALFEKIMGREKSDPEIQTEDAVFDGVPVRIYRPAGKTGVLPGFVFYHGGGWVVGNIEMYNPLVSLMSKLTGAVFVSVEYRRAPENVFPAAHDDCVTATKYFITHAQKYNVDPMRIAVGGDSAGGNLAATVALRLRDESFEPKLKMQVLIYPSLQAIDLQLPSMQQNANGPVVNHRKTAYFKCMYLDGNETLSNVYRNNGHVSPVVKKRMSETYLNVAHLPERYLKGYVRPSVETGSEEIWELVRGKMLNPYFSPLMADDVSGLPMSYVFTCEYDLLRDEGLLYVHRLKEAGNDVTSVNAELGIHGVISMAEQFPEARVMLDEIVAYIVANL